MGSIIELENKKIKGGVLEDKDKKDWDVLEHYKKITKRQKNYLDNYLYLAETVDNEANKDVEEPQNNEKKVRQNKPINKEKIQQLEDEKLHFIVFENLDRDLYADIAAPEVFDDFQDYDENDDPNQYGYGFHFHDDENGS